MKPEENAPVVVTGECVEFRSKALGDKLVIFFGHGVTSKDDARSTDWVYSQIAPSCWRYSPSGQAPRASRLIMVHSQTIPNVKLWGVQNLDRMDISHL